MKLKIKYIDQEIDFNDNSTILTIEIENKNYFYRFVNDLFSISLGEVNENIYCFDDKNNEINLSNKVKLFVNYFDFDFNSKKYVSEIYKYLDTVFGEQEKNEIIQINKKLVKYINKGLNKTDVPLKINNDFTFESILKYVKVSIDNKNSLLDNLFLIIDLECILKVNNIIFFVNLKQYLNDNELIELYKYSLYNNIKIVLIDSQCYKINKKYEKKLIVDKDLDEFFA